MTEKEKKAPVGTIRENIADQMPKKTLRLVLVFIHFLNGFPETKKQQLCRSNAIP
jgi:hypothetical protein